MISKMEWERKFGLMELNIREIIYKGKNTVLDNSFGLMDLFMKENSSSTTFRELVSTNGLMVVNMMENGRIIRWMGKA